MLVINQSLVSEEFIIFAMDGMRLPLNSEGDSIIFVGEKDLDLAHRLSKAGTDHSKYLRQIPEHLKFVCHNNNWQFIPHL